MIRLEPEVQAMFSQVQDLTESGAFGPQASDVTALSEGVLSIVKRTAGGAGRSTWPVQPPDVVPGHSKDLFEYDVFQDGRVFTPAQAKALKVKRGSLPRVACDWSAELGALRQGARTGNLPGRPVRGFPQGRPRGNFLRRIFRDALRKEGQGLEKAMTNRIHANVRQRARERQAQLRAER